MQIKKTLTGLVCSAMTALALSGNARAEARADLTLHAGVIDMNLHKDGHDWSEVKPCAGLNAGIKSHEGSWAYAAKADFAFHFRGPSSEPGIKQVSMDALLGHSHDDKDLKPYFLVGAVQSYDFVNTQWLEYGFDNRSKFKDHSEARLRGRFTALSLCHEWHKKTDLSEKTYLVRADIGKGAAREEAHYMRPEYPHVVILVPETEINYLQASFGGEINLRNLLQRNFGGKDDTKFLGWEEYDMGLRLISQSGGYSNLMIKGEIAYFWPLTQIFDSFVFGSIIGVMGGTKPEDVRGNGNVRYDTHVGAGFRFSRPR